MLLHVQDVLRWEGEGLVRHPHAVVDASDRHGRAELGEPADLILHRGVALEDDRGDVGLRREPGDQDVHAREGGDRDLVVHAVDGELGSRGRGVRAQSAPECHRARRGRGWRDGRRGNDGRVRTVDRGRRNVEVRIRAGDDVPQKPELIGDGMEHSRLHEQLVQPRVGDGRRLSTLSDCAAGHRGGAHEVDLDRAGPRLDVQVHLLDVAHGDGPEVLPSLVDVGVDAVADVHDDGPERSTVALSGVGECEKIADGPRQRVRGRFDRGEVGDVARVHARRNDHDAALVSERVELLLVGLLGVEEPLQGEGGCLQPAGLVTLAMASGLAKLVDSGASAVRSRPMLFETPA